MNEHYLHTKTEIPKKFLLPNSYIDFINQNPIPDLEPWWFLCEFEKTLEYWLNELAQQYPNRYFIPFAKKGYSDDLACFDGRDCTGDPIVIYVHAFASQGWETRGSVTNFSEWLKIAYEESALYKSEYTD